jgi:predicted nucleotidyltransferase
MPSGSSSSAGAIFLDRDGAIAALRELARRLAGQDARVHDVVLFGSLATGRATIRSDADLLIVLRDHPLSPRDRIPEYLEAFLPAPMPVDVFPFTEAEIASRRAARYPFLATVEAQGISLL